MDEGSTALVATDEPIGFELDVSDDGGSPLGGDNGGDLDELDFDAAPGVATSAPDPVISQADAPTGAVGTTIDRLPPWS